VNRIERLLLDASTWVAASDLEDRFNAKAFELATAAGSPVAALDLTLYEVANVIGARDRRPEDAGKIVELIVERCGDHLVRIDADLIGAGIRLAAKHSLTAYDAAYVAAARRYGWTLVSTDIRDLVSKGLAVTPDAADYP
jgi:predicted nucleic acid-binding protein